MQRYNERYDEFDNDGPSFLSGFSSIMGELVCRE